MKSGCFGHTTKSFFSELAKSKVPQNPLTWAQSHQKSSWWSTSFIICHIHFNKEIVNINSSISGAGIEGVADSLEQLWISYNRVNTEIIKCKKIIFDLFSYILYVFYVFNLTNQCNVQVVLVLVKYL